MVWEPHRIEGRKEGRKDACILFVYLFWQVKVLVSG